MQPVGGPIPCLWVSFAPGDGPGEVRDPEDCEWRHSPSNLEGCSGPLFDEWDAGSDNQEMVVVEDDGLVDPGVLLGHVF